MDAPFFFATRTLDLMTLKQKGGFTMLKNDMRNYMLAGNTFEEFVEDYGETYLKEFSLDTMERCWKNTYELMDRGEWLRYLKKRSADYVRYLTMTADAMLEEGVRLNQTRAGGMLAEMLSRQRVFD